MAVTQEAMIFLSQLPTQIKLAPVSIVGPICTGKSFLANLLVQQDSAFKIAQQAQGQSTTIGIQIWSNPIQISKDLSILLMDTQGLTASQTLVSGLRSPRGSGSTVTSLRSPRGLGSNLSSKVVNTDKLLQLASLLSSTLILNLQGAVSDRILEYLEPITRLYEQIIRESKDPKISIDSSKSFNESTTTQVESNYFVDLFSKHLICLLRDFAQIDLKSSSSYAPITPAAMLENCLKPLNTVAVKKNKLQEQVKTIFKHRDCLTLSKPKTVSENQDFTKLHLDGSELTSEVNTLLQAIFKGETGKKVQGKALNGSMLLGLAIDYLQVIQCVGSTPSINEYPLVSIHTSIERVAQEEANRQVDLALSNFLLSLSKEKPNLPKNQLEHLYQKDILNHTSALRLNLADFISLPEIILECKQFKQRAMILVRDILDENYTISYQLAVGVLGKLAEDNQAQARQDATSTKFKDRWTTLYSNFLQTDTENMFETLAECITKNKQANFLDYTRIDLSEFSSFQSQSDQQDSIESTDKRVILAKNQPFVFETLTSDFEQTLIQLQHNSESQTASIQMCYQEHTRKQKERDESAVSLQTINSDIKMITQESNDTKLEIESLQRLINQEMLILDDLNNFKELTENRQSVLQNSQLAEVDDQISKQQAILSQLQNTSLGLNDEINLESSKMQIEIQKFESEIQHMKTEIVQIEEILTNKESKSSMFTTTEQFLQFELIDDYLDPITTQLKLISAPKDIKQQFFQKQRDLNQMQLRLTDQEFAAKKVAEDLLIEARSELNFQLKEQQKALTRQSNTMQNLKSSVSELEQKQNSAQMEYVQQKELNIAHREELQDDDHTEKISLDCVVSSISNIAQIKDQMMQLEEANYELTIINQAKSIVVERLVELVPEMVGAIQQSQNGGVGGRGIQPIKLERCVLSIEDDVLRNQIHQLMRKYKLMV